MLFQAIEEQLEDEDCEDVHLLSKVADVLHSLFATYKTSFYPYFDQIVGHFVKLLVSVINFCYALNNLSCYLLDLISLFLRKRNLCRLM